MKNSKSLIIFGLLFLFSANINLAHAQFLKNILNTVKNTGQNRANNKASQATNNAIDKIDKPSNSNSQTANADTSSTNKVLGAFAKAAQQNPNDTSSADLTMKALGILTGGEGVSAADSASAIKSFMTGSSGDGYYYETTNTVVTNRGTNKAVNKTYFTASGEGRTEMNLGAMMGVSGGSAMIGLSRADNPKYSVMLDNEDKTYSLNVIDPSAIKGNDNYTATKIGEENVGGFACIHARLTSRRDKMPIDVWTSKSVPGYAQIEKWMSSSKSMATPDMLMALKEAGADGYFVKLLVKNKDISSEMLLTKVEQKSLPASLFTIPAGYTESKNNGVIGNLMKTAQKQK